MDESKAVCPTLARAPSHPLTTTMPKKPTIIIVKAIGTRKKDNVNKAANPINAIVILFLFQLFVTFTIIKNIAIGI